MDQRIIDLYDEYTHAPLPRRIFLSRLSRLVGGSAAAAALLPLLENNYAHAQMIAKNDARIAPSWLAYGGATGMIRCFQVKPQGAGKFPAVIVIHENRGLNPHIQDVTRRLAVDGFLAIAPDFLSPLGGTPDDQDQARDMFGKLDRDQTIGDAIGAVNFAKSHAEGNGKVGTVGFCWGGGLSNQTAVHSPVLDAAVVFYGAQPSADDAAKIKAKLLIHYAGLDQRINAGADAYGKALMAAGVEHTSYVYEGVNHAFNNDTNEARYNEAAAKLAWGRTVEFFKTNLA
jgi:carboxymethylenebutenolidase